MYGLPHDIPPAGQCGQRGRAMDHGDDTDAMKLRKARRGRGRLLRRFARHDGGSAVIEFSVLALPFLLLVFAILESSISFGAQQMLTNATDDMARKFRTGQVLPGDLEKDKNLVRDFICERIQLVVSDGCPGLAVELNSYTTFMQAAASEIPFDDDGYLHVDNLKIKPGGSGAKNQLRVYYRWPVMTDFMRRSMSNLPDGKTLLYATVTWQNEPFDD